MPMTIRELVTRFKFSTERRGVNKFNRTITRMKGSLRSLAALLGVTLGAVGVRSLFKMGQSAERASVSLKRLVGTDFGPLRRTLRSIQNEMNRIRAGSGQIIRTRDFDIAAAGFFRAFGRGEQQLKNFREIFTFAAKQSAITGQNVAEMFANIQQGLVSGDFSALLDLPGFTKVQQQLLQFRQQAIDPSEPGGRVALRNRMRALSRIIQSSAREQDKELGKVPSSLLQADIAAEKFKGTMDKLAKTMNQLLVPVLVKLNELLDKLNEKMGTAGQLTKKIKGFVGIGGDVNKNIEKGLGAVLGIPDVGIRGAGAVIGTAGRATRRDGGGATTKPTIINNTFHITGDSPDMIARQVMRALADEVNRAGRSIVPTENR